MKIVWRPNPLYSYVLLEGAHLKILRLKCHIEELKELLSEPAFQLDPKRRAPCIDLDKLHAMLDYKQWASMDPESPMGKQVERLYQYALAELKPGSKHCGDCTCFPMSCGKCWAEDLLEINTIKDVGKHSLHMIDNAFNGKDDGSVTINQAIQKLRDYVPHATWEGWQAHADRWKAQATEAAFWLAEYRNTHFPEMIDLNPPSPSPIPVLKG